MPSNETHDAVEARAATAIAEADSGSNHQIGSDGDDESVADQAGADTTGGRPIDDPYGADHPTGTAQAQENAATESPS